MFTSESQTHLDEVLKESCACLSIQYSFRTVQRISWHVRIALSKRKRVNCVGDVELRRLSGNELMDMSPVPNHALTVRHMEVARHPVHNHRSMHTTTLPSSHVGERIFLVTQTLLRTLHDLIGTPALGGVGRLQLITRVAASGNRKMLDYYSVANTIGTTE